MKKEKNRDCGYIHAIGETGTLAMPMEHEKSPGCAHERGEIETGCVHAQRGKY